MKTASWLAVAAVASALGQSPSDSTPGASAAQAAATRIGDHHVGERLEEWLAISHYLDEIDTVCGKHKNDRRPWYVKATDKSNCERLSSVRDGRLVRDTHDGRLGKIVTGDDDRTFTWEFLDTDGRLAEVSVDVPGITPHNSTATYPKQLNAQEEIAFLIEKYGPPAATENTVYQNAYGAKWDCAQASWSMPDGTSILAHEFILSSRRQLVIIFTSSGYLQLQKAKGTPNPYGPKP